MTPLRTKATCLDIKIRPAGAKGEENSAGLLAQGCVEGEKEKKNTEPSQGRLGRRNKAWVCLWDNMLKTGSGSWMSRYKIDR